MLVLTGSKRELQRESIWKHDSIKTLETTLVIKTVYYQIWDHQIITMMNGYIGIEVCKGTTDKGPKPSYRNQYPENVVCKGTTDKGSRLVIDQTYR